MTIRKGSELFSNKIGRTTLIGTLAILAMVGLAACGTVSDAGSTTDTQPTAISTPTQGLTMPALEIKPTDTPAASDSAAGSAPATPADTGAATDSGVITDSGAASSAGGAEVTTEVQATLKEWSLTLSQSEVPAGKVQFTITNEGMMPHNFTVTDSSGEIAATPNFPSSAGPQTLMVELKPGTYTLICSLPGHAARGQMAELVVK